MPASLPIVYRPHHNSPETGLAMLGRADLSKCDQAKKNGLDESAHAVCQRKADCNLRRGAPASARLPARRLAAPPGPCQNPAATRGRTPPSHTESTMGFLAGKRLLITGLLSNRSIAYGIARACHREGAELAFSYQGERFRSASPSSPPSSARAGLRLRRRRRRPDRARCSTQLGAGLAAVRRLRALHRLRAARGDRRRLPRRPVARGLPHRARHLGLQLPGAWPRPPCPACAPARRC